MKIYCCKNRRHNRFVHNVPIPAVLDRHGQKIQPEGKPPVLLVDAPGTRDPQYGKLRCLICGGPVEQED
jgi:hypothetical protein